jgi:hypothetical protein
VVIGVGSSKLARGLTSPRASATTAVAPAKVRSAAENDFLRVRFGPVPSRGEDLDVRMTSWAPHARRVSIRVYSIRSDRVCPGRSVLAPARDRLISAVNSTGRFELLQRVPMANPGRYRVCVYLEALRRNQHEPTRTSPVIGNANALVNVP